MVSVVYYDPDDKRYEISARSGDSLMETAVIAGVPGIDAICGGSCICGTCHVYVEERRLTELAPQTPAETEILKHSAHARANSRLSCQIRLSDELDGIVVHIPVAQG